MKKLALPGVGMRMVKTVIAAFICAIIDSTRGYPPFYSMIAAILCMQPNNHKAVKVAVDRTMGTLIGGIVGYGVLEMTLALGVISDTPLYYAIICVFLIPVIYSTVLIKRTGASAISCVVFLCVTVIHYSDASPLLFVAQRVFATLIGIAVALVVNMVLPNKPEKTAEEDGAGAPGHGK